MGWLITVDHVWRPLPGIERRRVRPVYLALQWLKAQEPRRFHLL